MLTLNSYNDVFPAQDQAKNYNALYEHFIDLNKNDNLYTSTDKFGTHSHDMAAAITAIGFLNHGHVNYAKHNLDYLINKALFNRQFGWGLGVPWEAFANGIMKDASVIYGIETAWGIRALLDMYELDHNIKYLIGAIYAAHNYKQYFTHESRTSGFFWYDEQNSDAIFVANVNAMLMSQYARLYSLFPFFAEEYKDIAMKTYNHLNNVKKISRDGVYWTYSSLNNIPNDLVHAALTIEGVIRTERYLNLPSQKEKLLPYLNKFINSKNIYENTTHEKAARLWGVGMLMYVLCTENPEINQKEINSLLQYLRYYERPNRSFSMYQNIENVNVDASAHLFLGVSKCSI